MADEMKDRLTTPTTVSERDRLVVRRRQQGWTLAKIGEEVGLTRERVRQILGSVGGPSTTDVRATRAEQRREKEDAQRGAIRQWLTENGPAKAEDVAAALGIEPQAASRLWPAELVNYRIHGQTASRRWTESEVLEALRQAATFEYPLRISTYDHLVELGELSGPKAVRVMQIFGTWRQACELAGVEAVTPTRHSYNSVWTDDDLWSYVVAYLGEAQRSGTFADLDAWLRLREDAPSAQTIRNRLGSWNRVKAEGHRRSNDD